MYVFFKIDLDVAFYVTKQKHTIATAGLFYLLRIIKTLLTYAHTCT